MIVQSFPVKHASYLHIIRIVTEEKVLTNSQTLAFKHSTGFSEDIKVCKFELKLIL